jgi:hypothetical protein
MLFQLQMGHSTSNQHEKSTVFNLSPQILIKFGEAP